MTFESSSAEQILVHGPAKIQIQLPYFSVPSFFVSLGYKENQIVTDFTFPDGWINSAELEGFSYINKMNGWIVPIDSIYSPFGETQYVIKVIEGNAALVKIKVLRILENNVIIIGDIKEGDILIFSFVRCIRVFLMPKEEDPRLKERYGVLKIVYPGASLETMNRLVTIPTEEALAEIPEIKTLEIRVRPEVMIAEIRLSDHLSTDNAVNDAWKREEDSIKKAEPKFPTGLHPWDLNRRVTDQEAVLVALTGTDDLFYLKEKIETLRSKLLQLPDVSKITRIADPEEEVEILIPKKLLEDKGLSLRFLLDWVYAANHNIPPRSLSMNGKKVIVKTDGWFTDLTSISERSIPLSSGELKSFRELGTIRKNPKYPITKIMRSRGQPALGLGIVAKKNINLVQFGNEIENSVIVFVGRTVPLFYYNLNQSPSSPHIAQFILNLKSIKEKEAFKADFQKKLDAQLLYGNAILQELKQGPPVKAPMEIRIFSDQNEDLLHANQIVLNNLYKIPGLKDIRSDLSVGTPVFNWESDDASLSRYKSTRSDVSLAILSQTRGIPIVHFYVLEQTY